MASPTVIKALGQVLPEGPWGGTGGDIFFDGLRTVTGITITYSEHLVWSLHFHCAQDTYGSRGPCDHAIKLDSPNERLVQVKGTTAPGRGVATDVVTSLTFITNKTTYGPYGKELGQPFQSSPNHEVLGFYGRAGRCIDALGTFAYFPQSATDVVLS